MGFLVSLANLRWWASKCATSLATEKRRLLNGRRQRSQQRHANAQADENAEKPLDASGGMAPFFGIPDPSIQVEQPGNHQQAGRRSKDVSIEGSHTLILAATPPGLHSRAGG